ncbi:MAG: hypothetical protein HY235_24885 [Acidobacteria bacterium]|nr:hypothetical protein [Acidobacteriota bacterium]
MAETASILVRLMGGDRQPWAGPAAIVQLVDPFASSRKILAETSLAAGKAAVRFLEVPADRGQRYAVLASAKNYREAGIYPVQVEEGKETAAAVMLIGRQPSIELASFSFTVLEQVSPAFHRALRGSGVTEADFLGLPPERIAGALNIEAKLRNTALANTPAVRSVRRIGSTEETGVQALHQDRVFAWVDPGMPDQVRAEVDLNRSFIELPDFANEAFHRGYPVSFKQQVPFGSLQLSFARLPGDNALLAADIDIDLFTDIGHFGEVLTNHILSRKTDPYTVYTMLFDQGIEPLYAVRA